MNSQIAIAVVLATALSGAAVVVALGSGSSTPPPDSLPGASAHATAAVPGLPPPIPVEAAASDPGSDATTAAPVLQRTLVEARANRGRIDDEGRLRLRTSALATKLELSPADGEALLCVLLEEQLRRADALRDLQGGPDQEETRARVRTGLDAILVWKTRELHTRFGPERAEIMMRR